VELWRTQEGTPTARINNYSGSYERGEKWGAFLLGNEKQNEKIKP